MTATVANSSSSSASSGLASLLKLLPTGTVFLFEFLNPVLSKHGKCKPVNKILSAILIAGCGLSCIFASFTDSYIDKQGKTCYGIVTPKGLLTFTSDSKENEQGEDKSKYKLRIGDFVHAGLSLLVFAVVAVLDSNTVKCFVPRLESSEDTLLAVLPVVVGAISSTVFMLFPCTRHGIGFAPPPPSSSSTSKESSSV
ncbi:hypothetical protein Ancab_013457 [Ancistrocladus abbreviatus]